MRFWISGPRLFGGLIRPGVSFRAPRFASSTRDAAARLGDFVYVVENDLGHVKIGMSGDPDARKLALQTGSSVPLTLVFSIFAADRAFDVEQEAHAILGRYRLPGEWFDASKEAAIASVYAAAARLKVPLGDDVGGEGASMERKLFGATATAAVLFFVWAVSGGLPMVVNQVAAGAFVCALLWRRYSGRWM